MLALIGLRLLGWGKAALDLVRTYPWQAALIAALLWGAYERHDAIHARALTVQWREIYRAGQRNVAGLKAAKAHEDARQAANTKGINDATAPARSAALAAGDAYARAHAVRVWRSAQVAAAGDQRGNLPGAAADPGGAETAAAPADMVAVSRADFDACTLNTADLGLAYQWARGLTVK